MDEAEFFWLQEQSLQLETGKDLLEMSLRPPNSNRSNQTSGPSAYEAA